MGGELSQQSATALATRLTSGEISAAEVADAFLAQVAEREATVGAWAFIDPDGVRAQAAALDARRAAGEPTGPLHGLPVALKDVIDTADMPTENGCRADAGRQPERDAVLVARLRAAGAIVMGKTVTAELAHREPGKTANPHDPSRTPGGSSSGSAAAVAAAMAPLAVGTQTGGSMIRPAAYCGVVGYKPTIGLIPTRGVFRRSHTLDTMGTYGRTVEDAALLAECLAGHDPETGALPSPRRPLLDSARSEPAVAPRFALVRQPAWDTADDDMKAAFAKVGDALGGQAEEVDLPPCFDRASAMYRIIGLAELSKYVAPYVARAAAGLSDGMREDVATGAQFGAVDYLDAVEDIAVLNEGLGDIFAEFDAILTPSAPGQAPVGLANTGSAAFCSTWTLCGTPAISLPLLTGADGMPMGLQLVGARNDDARLLRTAAWLTKRLGGGV